MLGLIQRVTSAEVRIKDAPTASIGAGLLLFLGIQKGDTSSGGDKLLHKLVNYRIFDAQGSPSTPSTPSLESNAKRRMNLSLRDMGGELLIVSQFTLAADTAKGLRPSFSSAAAPEEAQQLYDAFVAAARQLVPVTTGKFSADMQVSLVNDGPVTFLLTT